MASPILAELEAQVTRANGVMVSATTLINGFAHRLEVAIEAALANGATAEELVPVQAEADALRTSADALAVAVETNP